MLYLISITVTQYSYGELVDRCVLKSEIIYTDRVRSNYLQDASMVKVSKDYFKSKKPGTHTLYLGLRNQVPPSLKPDVHG